jgi:small-conductance mechanosensitive channel/CRP-like cAMP-binding protein
MWWSFLILLVVVVVRAWHAEILDPFVPPNYQVAAHQAATVAIALALFFFVDRIIRRHYWHGYLRQRRNREAPAVVKDIVTLALLLLGLGAGLWWLNALSFPVLFTATVATVGAIGFVAGNALGPVFLDLFSGVAINFDRSYALGDWLTVYSQDPANTFFGRVAGINWRTTCLALEDGTELAIPNRLVALNPLVNHNRSHRTKEISVEVGLDMRFPAPHAVNIVLGELLKLVRKPGFATTPPPAVTLARFSADAAVYEVRLHIHPDRLLPREARSVVLQDLHEVIRQDRIPSAATTIEIRQPPASHGPGLGESEIVAVLSRVPLFHDALSSEQAGDLARRCKLTELAEGQDLMRQGEQASSLFVILDGAARVWISDSPGQSREVAVLAMGDVVGEMSLLTGASRNATVTALTRLRAIEITKRAVAELVNKSPEVLTRFAQILLRRRHELQELSSRGAGKEPEIDLLKRIRDFFFPAARDHADTK